MCKCMSKRIPNDCNGWAIQREASPDYWTLIYVRLRKLWTIAHWFYANYANKFKSFCYLSLGMPFGLAVLAHFFPNHFAVLSVQSFLQLCFQCHTDSDGCHFFFLLSFSCEILPYTFEYTQTSSYHFIILCVSFSWYAVSYISCRCFTVIIYFGWTPSLMKLVLWLVEAFLFSLTATYFFPSFMHHAWD